MTQETKTYEGMFLVPPGPDFQAASEPVHTVLARSDAEVLTIKAWDERRLAYDISDQRRGLYILTYFKADPSRIGELEHDCQLAEGILRVLIIRKDRLSDEQINAETPADGRAAAALAEETPGEAPAERPAEPVEGAAAKPTEKPPADEPPADEPPADEPAADQPAPDEPPAGPEEPAPDEQTDN